MASTTLIIVTAAPPEALDIAEQRLRQLETRWSRFIGTSDVSRLNEHAGRWVPVSSDTVRLVETMQAAHRATGGGFDPTLLHQLISIGYRSSIDDDSRCTVTVQEPDRTLTIHDVEIDRAGEAVRLPAGVSIDPGGIGKGLAADLVVTELTAAGAAGALVDVGGDIAAIGEAPSGIGWIIEVEDPHHTDGRIASFALSAGGVATSSTRSRRWRIDGIEHHHVIDPATGADARTDLATMTVIAGSGWLAEAHATAALLRGTRSGIDDLGVHGLAGIAVALDGRVSATPGFDVGVARGVRS